MQPRDAARSSRRVTHRNSQQGSSQSISERHSHVGKREKPFLLLLLASRAKRAKDIGTDFNADECENKIMMALEAQPNRELEI